MKRLIATILTLVILAGLAATAAADGLGTGVVKGGWLRLRIAPNTLAGVIGRYYTGTKVTVHSATGSWYYVTAPDGQSGYMSRNYITLNGGAAPYYPGGWSGIPSGETGYVTSQNGRGVRLRSTPTAVSSVNVIGLYSVGTRLTVLQKGSGWHYIQIGSQTGYMMSQFIILGSAPMPPVDPVVPVTPDTYYTAYITSQNGKGVRLRSGPGVNYSMLGTYPVGTKVTVLKDLGAWSYIQLGSKKGYMMSTFLTTYAPDPGPVPPTPKPVVGSITDAQITIQDPIKGDRLYVHVTPDGAEYNVLWYNETGALLGSGNGYVVKASDSGHRIRARVIGRNGWGGSIETLYTDQIGGSSGGSSTPKILTGQVFLSDNVRVNDILTPMIQNCNASALTITWYVDGLKYGKSASLKITSDMAGKTVQAVVTAEGYQNSLTAVTTVKSSGSPSTDSGVDYITPGSESTPIVEPVTPIVEPITPVVEPITPVVEPVTPVVEPVTPVVEPVTPVVEPVTPVVEPVTPVVEPVTPVVEPVTPVVEPVTPVVEPITPVVEPVTPSEPSNPAAPLVEYIVPGGQSENP